MMRFTRQGVHWHEEHAVHEHLQEPHEEHEAHAHGRPAYTVSCTKPRITL